MHNGSTRDCQSIKDPNLMVLHRKQVRMFLNCGDLTTKSRKLQRYSHRSPHFRNCAPSAILNTTSNQYSIANTNSIFNCTSTVSLRENPHLRERRMSSLCRVVRRVSHESMYPRFRPKPAVSRVTLQQNGRSSETGLIARA